MQNLVIIFGPPAVGKMTVGRALAQRTGLKLFHNHMTIELALQFFDYGQPAFNRLVYDFRQRIFEEVLASDLPGLIFTWVWALELESDRNYIEKLITLFESKGAQISFVELTAPLETLLERNQHPERLEHKPSKRNLQQSEKNLQETVSHYKINSDGDFPFARHLKIDNQDRSPESVAQEICQYFSLPEIASN